MVFCLPLLFLAASLALAKPMPRTFDLTFQWPQVKDVVGGSATANTSTSTACEDVHIIVVRASQEPASQGILGTLATKIATAIPGTSVEWINYPAELIPYDTSSTNGTYQTLAAIQNYVNGCSGKLVLLGYSQGAQVVGDVMCGGGGDIGLGPYTAPLASKYAQQVVAVVQMGDPRHMAGKSWDAGNATTDGLFPRPANVSCDPIGSKFKSYCDIGDPFCALGLDVNVHTTYCDRYNDDAYNFVIGKLEALKTVTQTGNGGLVSSGSPTESGASPSPTKKSEGARPMMGSGAPLALAMVLLFCVIW